MIPRPRLYVLDDDAQYANLLVEIATSAGWLAVSEQSPAKFLTYDLQQHCVLILDLNMPEMDGIEVIRALAEKHSDLLLILISGFDARVLHSAQQLAEAHNIKVLATLTKPVRIDDFTQVLDLIKPNIAVDKTIINPKDPVSVAELEQAIQQHQLVLHYQPQVDIETGALRGVEALVRWQHPERGMIFPDQFIDLAEKNGVIGLLTEEVIELAIKQSRHWKTAGLDVVISVNVSAENITSLSLPEQLITKTDKHAINPEKIMLEITESAVMGELTSSLDVLNRLRMKGFSLSIDDFGTGYSSLSQLYQAPFTELKIDQSFVMRMVDDTAALVIVKICIMLGKMLGMRLVAEGVETREVWDKLRELGCDIAQGYFIARPMPAEAIIEWERSREKTAS
ncbi:EAL domain-containing protein [Sulfuriflexus mobilis]|uniref:GGDEF/EAL domain-containing response regulator n=1 Tax=Sulfuriflexus mobilis TaxID=1811807 RepID=UPI000F8171DA|nr:EAL domain-containing response regulator [Sulfuriflexus mobilis]